ncbi:MAG TPA: DNA primase [Bacteroidetes bacterium]|nr:DNA primase [Bacteroidota bacterium]
MAGRIPPDIIDRIRESTDIVELISGYVQLQRKGSNYFGLCPFHPEKTPSFSVHPGKQIFHCFGCGIGGNVFTFLQEHDKLSFAEAARELAQRAGIAIPEDKPERVERYDALYHANEIACEFFNRCLWEGKGEEFDKVRAYLGERKISTELAKSFRLGYAPDRWDGLIAGIKKLDKNNPEQRNYVEAGLLLVKEGRTYDRFRGRLMFPIFNLSGKPVGFGGRTLKAEDEGAKYINTPQTPIYNKGALLYGLHLAREQVRRRGECLIVEGYTDLMRLHDEGFTHAVATSGTALTTDQARILRRFCRKVVLVFDGDAAGSHAALRGGDVLLGAELDVRVVGLPKGYDPDSYLLKEGASAFGNLLEGAADVISYRIELYRQEGRLADVSSRTEVARELLASLAVIPDPIRRELATQDAARKIGLGQETLLRQLARMRRAFRTPVNEGFQSEDPFAGYPVKERGLLEALIRWPELRPAVFNEINSQDLQHPSVQRIAAKLEDAWVKGEAPQGEEIIDEDTPIEDTSFISYSLSQMEAEAAPGVDPKAMRRYIDYRSAQDCLRDILTVKLQNVYQKLKSELAVSNNKEEQRALMREIKETLDRQKAVRARIFWETPIHPSMDIKERQNGDHPPASL